MTLPFFGSGLVELPPGGEKRAKNCRKMQMCFFVHVGKVMVEVYPAGGAGGEEVGEVTQFAISRGGVWVVPRGTFGCGFFLLLLCFARDVSISRPCWSGTRSSCSVSWIGGVGSPRQD